MFSSDKEKHEMMTLLEGWTDDPQHMKAAFLTLKQKLIDKKDVSFSFISRPGISYSLRVSVNNSGRNNRKLFALIDIVDDQAEGRWLSVCFYSDLVSDPGNEGNLVPNGILGEDGYCFDLFEYDHALIHYIEQRIDEAYESAV